MDNSMKLEVFKEIIGVLKEHQTKIDNAYKAGIDLINFCDPLEQVISLLIGSYYGKEGKETFNWWCYDKNWGERIDLTMTDKDGNELCRTIEELHQWLEENKTDDYELPHYMSTEERIETIKKLFL
jgi:hypothetical protein